MTDTTTSPTQPQPQGTIPVAPAGEPKAQAEIAVVPPPKRVRVGWVAGECTLERLARTLQPLAVGLLDEVVDVVVICPQRSATAELPSPPLEIVRYGRLKLWIFRTGATENLVEELRPMRLQVLHALDADACDLTRHLAAALNLRYIVSSYRLGDGRIIGGLDQRAEAVLAASEQLARDLLEHRVCAAAKIRVVRPGVHHVRHTTLFDHPQQSTAVVAGGRLDDVPAFEAVLKAFAAVKDRKYDCVFFIIGSGRAERALRLMAEKAGLDDVLTFVDRQPPAKLAGIFKAADIYIAPLPEHGVDIECLLAMAAGDPVLAAAGGSSDFLIDSKTALLFTMGDTDALTARLLSLLDNHAAARQQAEDALKYLREKHSQASMVTALADIYRTAANLRPLPAGTAVAGSQ